MADTIKKKTSMKLPARLTDDELLKYGKALAQTESEIAAENERQDGIKAGLKIALADIQGRRAMLAGVVSSGEEMRDVDCEDHFVGATCKVIRFRLDTGEQILERPMTEEERQRSFLGDL